MDRNEILNWIFNNEIIDLSINLNKSMRTYPTVENPEFKKLHITSTDGFQDTKICLNTHTGTHIDAPSHMIDGGLDISETAITSLIGRAIILNLSYKKRKEEITKEDLMNFHEQIEKNDMIILYTGWTNNYDRDFYSTDYPYLDISGATYLSSQKIKFVGTDGVSIAGFTKDTNDNNIHIFKTHRLLLERKIYIGEELNTTQVRFQEQESFIEGILIALPIKIIDGDAGWSRIIFIKS
ncbi:cyclase family protein [Thermoplasma sp.]|uniref:cyclase family protein n=1 Tax=Thermoplasma sp. TaxID=1973142 RepID=UPI002622F843|nr:cyclase family protein [Thermoplasma sp.]